MSNFELLKKLNKFYIYSNEGFYIDKVIKEDEDEYVMAYSKNVEDYEQGDVPLFHKKSLIY